MEGVGWHRSSEVLWCAKHSAESEASFLAKLEQSRRERAYHAQAVRRVCIPKAKGKLSPRLANIYLLWFDRVFHRADGQAQWAKAKLVRYANDFVELARRITPRLQHFVESKLEG